MKYSVGQVLFLLIRKDKRVVPVKIIEEIVRKTLDEEVVSYNVLFPDKKSTVTSLSNVDAQVFTDIYALRAQMIESATAMIDGIVDNSLAIARTRLDYEEVQPESIDVPQVEPEPSLPDQLISPENFDDAKVDLGNGMTARIKSSAL
jgi:hypothetical protein